MKVNNQNKIIVGISCGDLNGIGTEVVLKTFEDKRMFDSCTPVLFANSKLIISVLKHFNISIAVQSIDSFDRIQDGKLNVFNVWDEKVDVAYGTSKSEIGSYAFKSLKSSVEALKSKKVDVLVTAPINKESIQSDEFKFPGHTGYLNQELEGQATMFMISEGLRMALLTDHLPLSEVSRHITNKLIQDKVRVINKSLKEDFVIPKPRIAVLGLNPHSGDGGVIGKEDDMLIAPAISALYDSGILVFGPYPADAFFGSGNYQQFDAVISCYHDQGLIPFKTLSFGNGVNYTSGLSYVRTSPDHGTAFDISGENKANAQSFREAVCKAIDIYNNRRMHVKYSSKPLEKQPLNRKK